jgi:hypothetical protein
MYDVRMMKTNFKRTKRDYGGGSGRAAYSSKLFEVTHWHLRDGKQTTVRISVNRFSDFEVRLEGHVELSSDKECLAVFTPTEILKFFNMFEKKGFKEGKEHARSFFSGVLSGAIDF